MIELWKIALGIAVSVGLPTVLLWLAVNNVQISNDVLGLPDDF